MDRARLYAAATFLVALLLARVAFAPAPPVAGTLAVPAPAAPTAPIDRTPATTAPAPAAPGGTASTAATPPGHIAPAAPGASGASPGAAAPATSPSRASPRAAAPSLDEVRAALAALDTARAAAFADPVTADPDEWATTACACHADDTRRLRELAGNGLALRGQRVTVDSLAFASPPGAGRADVVLVDRTSAYDAVDGTGRIVRGWPAEGPRRWRITLVRAGGRWLFGSIARAP